MDITAGLVAMGLAYVVHWKGIGPDWFAWRAAQVLSLAGMLAFLDPFADDIRGWIDSGLNAGADVTAEAANSAVYTSAITTGLPKVLMVIALVMWLGALLPTKISKWFGRFVSQTHSAGIVWGLGAVIVLFSTLAGGFAGDLAAWLLNATTEAGAWAAQKLAGA